MPKHFESEVTQCDKVIYCQGLKTIQEVRAQTTIVSIKSGHGRVCFELENSQTFALTNYLKCYMSFVFL